MKKKNSCPGHDKAVRTLINNGAKINTLNKYGYSALDFAFNATNGKCERRKNYSK